MMRRRAILMSIVPGGLPDSYISVEYLESTGTQCIDTGIIPNSNMDIALSKGATTGSYANCLFGANSGSNQYSLSATEIYYYGVFRAVPNRGINPAGIIAITGGKLYNGETLLYDASSATGASTVNLTLFCRKNDQNRYERFISMKVYSFKMWQNNELIMDMIPCKRIADSKPGMYDLIGRTFYVNQGTGEFITP